ncbi:MAG: hypothetical protein Q8O85_06305 [Rhodoferax sp.]|uniref:hypothetical protein n=1 Tax=Rhodoferax sp. TaxID=50421 RepID=UPI0026C5EACE|nr:hypothetical protein [Rhodoferax sp.]MDP2678320.1 hypothetical protein [Rhodoferax sp.]
MAISTVNRLIALFDTAFQGLSAQVSMAESERLAVLVHHAMNAKTRAYHTTAHVFDMCETPAPRQLLAAMFHDVVYYQLDAGFPETTAHLLHDVAHKVDGRLVLQPLPPDDRTLALCMAIFNFRPGQVLPLYGGMNEFLSAVMAARLLEPYLSAADLLAVVACIEATIAFRPPAADGQTAMETLALRVETQARAMGLAAHPTASAAYVDQVMADAVMLGNRDVSGFAKTDPAVFLSSTWLLIDESNAPLATPGVYSLQQYRRALTRMTIFLANLDPNTIFLHYKAEPSPEAVAQLGATAHANLRFSCDFLEAKVTSVAIIEALALCTGGDCPISMFLGDIRCSYGKPDRVEDFLPEAPAAKVIHDELLRVLEKGRATESKNELTSSPLTAFVYRHMGHQGTQQAFRNAKHMFEGHLAPQAFLQTLDRDMVRSILQACARIALSRSAALQTLETML